MNKSPPISGCICGKWQNNIFILNKMQILLAFENPICYNVL